MAGIFISYRRADSDGWAGRLRDALRVKFGNRVFQDVESIADGEIFSEVIDRALQECDVALIIIGPNWATASDDTGRRLNQSDDWVRTETALVLERKIRVIPVLVGGASMPRAEDLPEELRSLTKRQAREIRSNSWDSDVALLTNHLRQIVGRGTQRPAWHYALASLAFVAIGVFAGIRFFGQPALPPAPAERMTAPAAVAPIQADKAPPAATEVAPAPKIATVSPATTKPPESLQPAKVKPPPEPPKVARTEPPPEPRIARTEPPPVKDRPGAPPQEPARKPAVAQADPEPAPDRTAVTPPAAPMAAPPQPSQPAPAAAAVIARAATLNLPNRPASARELKIGDSWTYRLREVSFNKNLATVTHEIGGGDKGGIRETLRTAARGDTQRRLPLEPRIFEQPLDQGATLFEFAPFMTAFSELQPGVTWNKIAGATSSDSINDWRFSGKVTGRERVRVPAGSFDAIKAELEGQLHLSSPSTRDPFSETAVSYQTYSVWFAPEVGRAIKYERRTYNRGRRLLEHEQYELVSYRLQ